MPEKYKHTPSERNAMLRDLRRVIHSKDERELMSFLRAHGIKDENPRFSQIVKAFRDGKIDEILRKKP
jgi:ribosomal protein L12E/L44/L45/RPP1/RPP2